jgi:hypothetical protein
MVVARVLLAASLGVAVLVGGAAPAQAQDECVTLPLPKVATVWVPGVGWVTIGGPLTICV